jgi:TRAP-type C4-dicarboxylate transport system substrate-binding protein
MEFAFTGSLADSQIGAFEEALAENAGDDVILDVSADYDTNVHGVEQQIIGAVASGDLDLGWVGVRAFSELGVHEFDPLIAPMLLDSIAAQEAVLASGVPVRMLAGLDGIGVLGLAVMGGSLRRPIAADAPLLALADFRGIPFYSWHGDLNSESINALGARNIDVAPPERNEGIADGSIRAYENTVAYLADTVERRARIMTTNIDLWPSISVLVMNPATFQRMPKSRQDAILRAAEEVSAVSAKLGQDDPEMIAQICAGGGRFASARSTDVDSVRAAFGSVYERLHEDPATAALLEEVIALTEGLPADTIDIPAGCYAGD